jgi:hypothetical protein
MNAHNGEQPNSSLHIDIASVDKDWPLDPQDPAIAQSTVMFNRVLASWASDLLLLRREGLSAPGWRQRNDDGDGIGWKRAA